MIPPYVEGYALLTSVAIDSRVARLTNPLPAARGLAGAPMKSFTLGLTEPVDAQVDQIA